MTRHYKCLFEVNGKKLKMTVIADSEEAAKELVRARIVEFHKVEVIPPNSTEARRVAWAELENDFQDLLNILK